ncbi:cytochrome P450 [Rhodococcoides kyotonense]|uniref:Cytochrome P450 n=1 Tax=Rhodococcoides kyotonense TaxID=398843 RepID=A0A239MHG3_9NOCA|nr:cytochrome P450 [Rhodococcus kyotonensis]SNT42477.1 Cytochrome P450 [Rhodococcus kyotonensis]
MPISDPTVPTPSVPPTAAVGPTLTGLAAARLLAKLSGPLVAGGVIARRRSVMPVLEKRQTDADTVRTMLELRREYGPGPLTLALPGRTVVIPLVAGDVERVLAQSPDLFTPANREKRAALSTFQPHGVLISRGRARTSRRDFNEQVLDTDLPLHHLAGSIAPTLRTEALGIVSDSLDNDGVLDAAVFVEGWWRVVRRVVLGDSARDDHAVTDDLWKLRADGNWSYLRPLRRRLRDRFLDRLFDYVNDAEPLSLAGAVAASRPDSAVDPVGQIPHWLFAFDAAGMVALRALAVLAAQPEHLQRARDEISDLDLSQPQILPYLRACILESVRLWPTTPAILRDSTATTRWGEGDRRFEIDSDAAFLILTAFFHRDPTTIDFADEFTPDAWLDGRMSSQLAVVPFSAGPARCPGQNLVLFVTSMILANIVAALPNLRQTSAPPLTARSALPATLNHYSITLKAT